MMQEKQRGWRAALALMCAAALMASMGMPVGSAARAFAGNSGDADCAEVLAVSDVAYEEDATDEHAADDPDEGGAAGADGDGESAADLDGAGEAEDTIGEDMVGAEEAQDDSELARDIAHDLEAPILDDCGVSVKTSAVEGEQVGEEVDDNSHIRTVYFGGDRVTTVEIGCAERISLQDIPMLTTSTIEVMGREVTGVFVGWNRCKVVGGEPQWADRPDLALSKGGQGLFHMKGYGTPLSSEELAQLDFGCVDGGDPDSNDIAFQPVWVAPLTHIIVHPCTPIVENGEFSGADFKEYEDVVDIWAPGDIPITPAMAREATLQALAGSNGVFSKDPYQYVGWYFRVFGGLQWGKQVPLTFPQNHSQDMYALFSTNPDIYLNQADDSDDADDSEGDDFVVRSNGTGVSVEGVPAGPNIPEGSSAVLRVNSVTAGDVYERLVAAMGDGRFAGVFEINLHVDGVRIHDGFGSLKVSFPVEGADGHWVTVYHLHEDGSITSERAVAVNGKVTIAVTDLSTFALEVGERYAATDTAVSPAVKADEDASGAGVAKAAVSVRSGAALAQTGDGAPVALAIAAALASAVALVLAAGAGRRAWGCRR